MRSLRSGIMSKEKRKKTLYALDFTDAGFEAVALAVEYGIISTRIPVYRINRFCIV